MSPLECAVGRSLVLILCTLALPVDLQAQTTASEDDETPTEVYPTLDDREPGELGEPPSGEIWGRALPFMAQKVLDLGFELPNPYGFSMIGARVRRDLLLSDLEISIDEGPMEEVDFDEFGVGEADNVTGQLKLDTRSALSAEPKKRGLFHLAGIAPTSDEKGFLSVSGGTAATAEGPESFRVADSTRGTTIVLRCTRLRSVRRKEFYRASNRFHAANKQPLSLRHKHGGAGRLPRPLLLPYHIATGFMIICTAPFRRA